MISAIWIVMVILANPLGNFPANDDWAYGWSVKQLREHGDFQLSDWTAVNLLTQVAWGALFCLPLGFSFTALRLSTVTLGLIGILASYATFRYVKATPGASLVGALAVGLNPVYFALSNSFMSDVPSFAFTALAAYFLVRALTADRTSDLALGTVLAVMAILNRQTGAVLLPGFGAAYLIRNGLSVRTAARGFAPAAVGLAAYVAYPQWLEMTGRTPHMYNFQNALLLRSLSGGFWELAAACARNLSAIAIYLGLFLCPVFIATVSWPPGGRCVWQRALRRLPFVILVAAVALVAAKYQRMPSIGNVLDVHGVWPSTMSGAAGHESSLLHRTWQAATALGVAGAALMLRSLWLLLRRTLTRGEGRVAKALAAFAIITVALNLIPISMLPRGFLFDRYLISVLPWLILLAAMPTAGDFTPCANRWVRFLCVVALVMNGAFAVAATHDHLAWNRVRSQAVDDLLRESRVSPADVDGGSARRGWYLGNRLATCNPEYRERAGKENRGWSDFACLRGGHEKYRVTPAVYDGYDVEGRYSFRRWLLLKEQTVYVLRSRGG